MPRAVPRHAGRPTPTATAGSGTLRCFVAVDLPDQVRAAVAAAQARLRATASEADVRWVSPEAFHLTLKFLGAVPADDLAALRTALDAVAGRHAPIAVAAGGLGTFPGLARPRVVWAGISAGVGELGLLAADLERTVAPLGYPPEERPFRGHLTVGRVRSPRGAASLARGVETCGEGTFGSWTATALTLFRSHLRPSGAVYEPLAHVPLAGRIGAG